MWRAWIDYGQRKSRRSYFNISPALVEPNSTVLLTNLKVPHLPPSVHAQSSCWSFTELLYSIIDGNLNDIFKIDNITGILKVLSPLSDNTTYTLVVLAEEESSRPSVNASVSLTIRVASLIDLNARTSIDFQVKRLGFIRDLPEMKQVKFGFFVNNPPGFEGRLAASVGSVSKEVSYSVTSTPAVSVKAVLISNEVWYDRPAVRVIVQVQDSAHSVRTLVDQSHVVVRITPGAKLSELNCGNIQQVSFEMHFVPPSLSNFLVVVIFDNFMEGLKS